jgi:hypothetical protein
MTSTARANVWRRLTGWRLSRDSQMKQSLEALRTVRGTDYYLTPRELDNLTASLPKTSLGFGARARSLVRVLLSWRI